MSDKAITRTLAHDIKLFHLTPFGYPITGQGYRLRLVVNPDNPHPAGIIGVATISPPKRLKKAHQNKVF